MDGNVYALNRHLQEEEVREAEADHLAELTEAIAESLLDGGEFKYGRNPGTHYGFENLVEEVTQDSKFHSILAQIAGGKLVSSDVIRDLLKECALEIAAEIVPHELKKRSNEHG